MKRIDFSGLPKLELEMPHPFSESDEAFGGKSVLCKGSSVKQDLQQLLRNLLTIPAHDYETWRNVCYVLKNEGYDFELFRAWSATADNYDSSACEKLWMDAAVRDDGLRMGTLVHMAQRARKSIPEMRPVPAVENIQKQLEQFYLFLSNNYPDDSRVEIVYEAFEKNGKYIPARSKAAYLSVPVQDTPFLEVFAEAQNNNAAGAWCSLNPVCEPQFLKGKATCDDDVTDYRYALVECDEMTKEEQWDFLSRYHLPIQSVVWSGGKSLHAVVRIEAGDNKQLYKERVDCLYSYLEYLGMPIDKANRNPSRLTRLPGFLRNDELQYCVAYQMGPGSWAAFSPYLELVLDNLSPVSEKLQSGKKITDARTVTSPINGQKGGRPEMPVTDLARDFFQMNKNSDDTPLLRHWCGEWYRYNTVNNRWDVMKQNELQMQLAGHLQRNNVHDCGRISHSLIRDIFVNLKADTLAGLPVQQYKMPCWLPDGSSAENWMCFKNQIVNVRELINTTGATLQSLPLTPEYFSKFCVDYDFDPHAECPGWMEYLNTTFDDPEIREMLQMMFGYILSGSTRLNVGFFLIGKGGDGKSVAGHILRKLVGENQTCCLPFSEMGGKFTSYMLSENLLNLVEELPVNSELRSIADCQKTYKMVTDGATIPTERKNIDPGSAKAIARCVFLANGMPNFTDKSDGLWDRIVLIPFDHRFRDSDEEKPNLKYDLEKELPGILNWAIAGGQKLQSLKRFPIPESVRHRIKQHRRLCNHEEDFFEERLRVDPQANTPKWRLYEEYSRWMQESGYKPLGKSKLNAALQDHYKDAIYEDRIRVPQDILVWRGIELI